MMAGAWIITACMALGAPEPSALKATPPPVPDGGPLVVGVGFHIVDFGRITAREETFDVTALMELTWRDPRLAQGAGADASLGGIWTPRINFDNAAEAPKLHGDPILEIGPDGRVQSRSVLTCRFSTPLDLRKFPFDAQDLIVRISLSDDASRIRFTPVDEAMYMHDDVFVTDWSLERHDYEVKTRRYRPEGPEYSVLEYKVRVDRQSTFYVWRVLLPLTLLSLIPTLVFWFEPVNLQPQISTCMGTLIAMLAFGYSVDFALPKVSYLTMIDRHAMIGFLFVTAATIAVAAVHRSVVAEDVPAALRRQRRLRVLYPAAYLVAAAMSLVLTAPADWHGALRSPAEPRPSGFAEDADRIQAPAPSSSSSSS